MSDIDYPLLESQFRAIAGDEHDAVGEQVIGGSIVVLHAAFL